MINIIMNNNQIIEIIKNEKKNKKNSIEKHHCS